LNALKVNHTSTLIEVSQKKTERAENCRRSPRKMQALDWRKSTPPSRLSQRSEMRARYKDIEES